MYNIIVNNVNNALSEIKKLLMAQGIESPSRNGPVIELKAPLMVTMENPRERCLFWPKRRWNPFFAFHEAMWIMAGHKDVEWLVRYNANMATWSDDGVEFNAPYGYRMRNHDMVVSNKKGYRGDIKGDQISEVIKLLKIDPNTRQAVIQIWDYRFDGPFKKTLDRACNMLVIFSLRNRELRMSVINRSNDLLLGFCNVNHVQFSILHEYVAHSVGARVGPYTHFSNCMHLYLEDPRTDKLFDYEPDNKYKFDLDITPLVSHKPLWDKELKWYMVDGCNLEYNEPWFNEVMAPLDRAWWAHKKRNYKEAHEHICKISSEDIRISAGEWLRRTEKIWENK